MKQAGEQCAGEEAGECARDQRRAVASGEHDAKRGAKQSLKPALEEKQPAQRDRDGKKSKVEDRGPVDAVRAEAHAARYRSEPDAWLTVRGRGLYRRRRERHWRRFLIKLAALVSESDKAHVTLWVKIREKDSHDDFWNDWIRACGR